MTTRTGRRTPQRAVAVGLSAALVVGAIGVSAAVAQDDAGEALEIAFIQTGPFPYYERGVEGARMAADSLGVELSVLNSDLSAEQEIANVEDAITQGVDGIVLFSVARASEEAALTKANEAGVPVAVLYGYAPELEDMGAVFVQADVNQTGTMAGEWLAANVPSGKIAIIQGALGRGDAEAYTQSFKEALAANPDLEIVGEPAGDWARDTALAAMQDLLTAHPDLAGVFVQNEDMALGAIQAIKAAGADVTIVSQNGSPEGLEAVESGDISATVGWSPAQEAQMALVRLVDTVRDGTVADPKLCSTPVMLVTAENLDEASPWVPTEESTAASLVAECGA
jgi:ABC-type sugar transport system substrate-binding protein